MERELTSIDMQLPQINVQKYKLQMARPPKHNQLSPRGVQENQNLVVTQSLQFSKKKEQQKEQQSRRPLTATKNLTQRRGLSQPVKGVLNSSQSKNKPKLMRLNRQENESNGIVRTDSRSSTKTPRFTVPTEFKQNILKENEGILQMNDSEHLSKTLKAIQQIQQENLIQQNKELASSLKNNYQGNLEASNSQYLQQRAQTFNQELSHKNQLEAFTEDYKQGIVLQSSIFEKRPATVFFNYPQYCNCVRSNERTFQLIDPPVLKFKIEDAHVYNCVTQSFKAAGFKLTHGDN